MRRRARRIQEQAELNITAFLNLMVILVPFLLITAVFSRITILELNIPPASDAPPTENQQQPKEKPLDINVIVRPNVITVAENLRAIRRFKKVDDDFVWKDVAKTLYDMKAILQEKGKDKTDANILVDENVSYETLISVMDVVRNHQFVDEDGLPAQAELFPDISIGDAPPLKK